MKHVSKTYNKTRVLTLKNIILFTFSNIYLINLTLEYIMQINTSSTDDTTTIISKRSVINAPDDTMLQLLPYKYQWAPKFFDLMYSNSWREDEVNLVADVSDWRSDNELSPQEREVFAKSLAFVSNLDTMQTYSLCHAITKHITAPEIQILIIRQLFEETIHVRAYSQMIEILGMGYEETYGRYRHDAFLKDKLDHICTPINAIMKDDFKTGTPDGDRQFMLALANNIFLEGVFFYSSFLMFYALARNGKMLNSARMIGLINRDEFTHADLITKVVLEIKKESPQLWTTELVEQIRDMARQSCELEIAWGHYILGNGIVGVNQETLQEYIQFLTDLRLKNLGIEILYGSQNPFNWIDEFTQINQELGAFFETTVNRYSQEIPQFESSSLEW